ncbi:MAG: M16 family metallopeptidase [Pyrinomonadaceae bacterium]
MFTIQIQNIRLKSALLAFVAGSIVLPVFAFAQNSTSSNSSPENQITEFEVNGLKILVKRRPGSATVAAGLFFRGGVRNLNAKNAGIENFMLSVATEASKKYPREVLRRELAGTGSGIGSGSNYDFSALSLASTREGFDRTWDAFIDIAFNPSFAPQDIELTRGKMLAGLREQESDPDNTLQVMVDKTINANTAYAVDPSGTIETVSSFKAEDLQAYHQKVMQTSRLLLVIVGDFDAETLKPRIAAAFGKLPRGDYKVPAVPVLDFSRPTLDITTRNLPTNYVEGVFNAPSLNAPDYYAMRIAISLLQGRIFQEVRVRRSLSYAPNAEMHDLAANTANIYVTAVDANTAVKVMLDEVKTMRTELIEQETIPRIAGHFLPLYYLDQETSGAQAAELAKYELIGGGWQRAQKFLDGIRSVTPEQIRAASVKYMKNIRFVVVGNPTAIDRSIFLQNSSSNLSAFAPKGSAGIVLDHTGAFSVPFGN